MLHSFRASVDIRNGLPIRTQFARDVDFTSFVFVFFFCFLLFVFQWLAPRHANTAGRPTTSSQPPVLMEANIKTYSKIVCQCGSRNLQEIYHVGIHRHVETECAVLCSSRTSFDMRRGMPIRTQFACDADFVSVVFFVFAFFWGGFSFFP